MYISLTLYKLWAKVPSVGGIIYKWGGSVSFVGGGGGVTWMGKENRYPVVILVLNNTRITPKFMILKWIRVKIRPTIAKLVDICHRAHLGRKTQSQICQTIFLYTSAPWRASHEKKNCALEIKSPGRWPIINQTRTIMFRKTIRLILQTVPEVPKEFGCIIANLKM